MGRRKGSKGRRRKSSMGRTVSYILRCICGEAEEEEKSDDEQNLLSYPLYSNSCSKSWIDSSSANNVAKHQFMFNRLDIQVSYEKAQRRSSCIDSTNIDQVLQPDNLLVAPPNLVPSIDPCISSSSTGGTLLREVFNDTLTDLTSIDSSTDEALQHELFIDPSTDVPCMDTVNDQELVHELFIDPSSTDVPSINTSNDQALVHELSVDPSIDVPSIDPCISSSSTGGTLLREVFNDTLTDLTSIDSSTDEALLHELSIDPSTDVPCMDMSNDQALVHELFIDSSSTNVPSINTNNDQALVHELSVDPSIDVPSIDSSTNEAFLPKLVFTRAGFRILHQFEVTDSNTQVVEDKSQVHSSNSSSKTKNQRKGKRAKARKEAAVVIERKIKHYSSLQKILLVGEGDFSFSTCLARSFGSASNIVATSLDSTEFLKANYKNAVSNICELKSRGAKVMHGVDATGMACNCLLNGSVYDRIIYNFPLVGFFPNESRRMQLKRNRGLIVKFFKNAKELIPEDGEIHISHKSWGFFLEWNLPLLASQVGLRLIEEVPFNLMDYRGYNTKFGFGGDENFNCNPSKTYKFGHKLKN